MSITCRCCGARPLPVVFSLGHQPLANRLEVDRQSSLNAPRRPLDLALCPACGLAQLTVTVPPEELFSDYAYFSSYSPAVTASAERLVGRLVADRGLGPSDLVVEAASNDGYLLEHYHRSGVPVLGVEPARNVAAVANQRGIVTRCAFFGAVVAAELVAEGRRASVLHAHNVLAHVADPVDFLQGVARLLRPNGVAVLEFPYLCQLVDELEFDTIYHEHLCYLTLTTVTRLLERAGLAVLDVEQIPLHGGSLRLFAGLTPRPRDTPTVARLLEDEQRRGVTERGYLDPFVQRVDRLLERLRSHLAGLRRDGARIAGYGAAAKATVLLNALGTGAETIARCADHSPHKQGRWIPGVGVPIVSPDDLRADPPDCVVVLAWNFADEILAELTDLRERGTSFLVPLPEPTTR